MPKSNKPKHSGARAPKFLQVSLRKAIEFLDDNNYRYAIIGGIALTQWGVVRTTRDVDIKVLVPDTNYAGARQVLLAEFPDLARTQAPPNPLILAVKIAGIIVDFLFAIPGYEELIVTRAVRRKLDGFQAWVCSAEDLIIQKVIAGRGKDWPDVELLLIEQRGKIDEAYIEDWLSQFAEALEKPEMLAEYKRLLQKVKALK
jgi:predicted nucleotidyltransferase